MRLTDRQWTLTGWWLFVACALCFIVAAARTGDMVGLAGACLFMAANIAFMVPFYRRPPPGEAHRPPRQQAHDARHDARQNAHEE